MRFPCRLFPMKYANILSGCSDLLLFPFMSLLEIICEEEKVFCSLLSQNFSKNLSKLSHEADGLYFQGWDDPYVPRTHEGLLKWKYPEMNSVDFLFEVVTFVNCFIS
ncbi:hypothetical protein HAX54_031951 [Datura stramonium]|uniref:mRNA capping enzyme adenylation domain-containing protein n=1 Tax=Datura stramonium TaxID=4076 RepID=A0ABS8SCB4_DATST|nr:hypothetical protein [Datura stramonium]